MSERLKSAVSLFSEGYVCSQAVFAEIVEDLLNEKYKLGDVDYGII